jgi:hypothetical protein
MTTAVCYLCGSFKFGAFVQCKKCGTKPVTDNDLALSMALSDRNQDQSTLEVFSACLQEGKPVIIDPDLLSRIKMMIASPAGARMKAMFQTAASAANSDSEPITNHPDKIARRLLSIEKASPGSLRMRANRMLLPDAIEALRRLGMKKPFFANPQQFLYDCLVSREEALLRFLPSCMLAGPTDQEGGIQCWAGNGRYMGEQGLLQLLDFTRGGKERTVLNFDIAKIFDQLQDLLDNPKRQE